MEIADAYTEALVALGDKAEETRKEIISAQCRFEDCKERRASAAAASWAEQIRILSIRRNRLADAMSALRFHRENEGL